MELSLEAVVTAADGHYFDVCETLEQGVCLTVDATRALGSACQHDGEPLLVHMQRAPEASTLMWGQWPASECRGYRQSRLNTLAFGNPVEVKTTADGGGWHDDLIGCFVAPRRVHGDEVRNDSYHRYPAIPLLSNLYSSRIRKRMERDDCSRLKRRHHLGDPALERAEQGAPQEPHGPARV
jgi:hypothetical protein